MYYVTSVKGVRILLVTDYTMKLIIFLVVLVGSKTLIEGASVPQQRLTPPMASRPTVPTKATVRANTRQTPFPPTRPNGVSVESRSPPLSPAGGSSSPPPSGTDEWSNSTMGTDEWS